jgi:DNA-nicking Smr family endonuclease
MRKKKAPTKSESPRQAEPEGFRPFAAIPAMRELRDETKKKAAASEPTRAPKPPSRPRSPEPQPIGGDDALAMHRLMSGVVPLDDKKMRLPRSQGTLTRADLDARRARAEAPAREEADAVREHLRTLVEGDRFEVTDDGRRVEGRRNGVGPEVVRRLRRGLLPIDARLDLPGFYVEEARLALERFLADMRARGERCVLVVHGKGEHSPGHVGVLRGEIAAWLSQGRASAHVAAFATARDEDGGEGAVYVLLAR